MAKQKKSSTQKLDFENNLVETLAEGFRREGSNATASFLWDSSTAIDEWISTGSLVLDTVLSNKENGGIPVGRLTEISGGEGAGKSLLASYILANTQKMGGVAIYIDTEHAASMEVLEEVGVDLKNLVYIQAGTIEDVFTAMDNIVHKIEEAKTDKLITIVWDSVAATSTRAEVEGEYSDQTIGMAARRIGQGLRKIIPTISTHRVACVFINQLRTKIGVTFGDNMDTPGGKAIPYHASIRLRLLHYQQIKDSSKKMVGRVIKCQVKKNKVAPPMREVFYHIRWGDRLGAWMDESATLLDLGLEAGFIRKVKAQSFELSSGNHGTFTKKKFEMLLKEPEFYEIVKKGVQDYLIITKDNINDDELIRTEEQGDF